MPKKKRAKSIQPSEAALNKMSLEELDALYFSYLFRKDIWHHSPADRNIIRNRISKARKRKHLEYVVKAQIEKALDIRWKSQ